MHILLVINTSLKELSELLKGSYGFNSLVLQDENLSVLIHHY